MIAIDTNILVRYIVEDDPEQTARANRFLETELSASEPGFVSLVTLAELFWTLRQGYRRPHAEVAEVIERLLRAPQLVVEEVTLVQAAIRSGHSGLGDLLIHLVGRAHGCRKTVTFDKAFARLAGVELLT